MIEFIRNEFEIYVDRILDYYDKKKILVFNDYGFSIIKI